MKVSWRNSVVLLSGALLALLCLCARATPESALFPDFEAIRGELHLTSAQENLWNSALARSDAARDSMRQHRQELTRALQDQLDKAVPDLAAVAELSATLEQADTHARQKAREQWLKLYATLSADQKAVVKNSLQAKLQLLYEFRAHMDKGLSPNG